MSALGEQIGLKSVVRLTSSWKGLQTSRSKSAFQHFSSYPSVLLLWLCLFACPAQDARFITRWDGEILWIVNLQNTIEAQSRTDIRIKSEKWR